MTIVYQHDVAGYYAGETDDYGGPMPHNCVAVKPRAKAGYIPRWTGEAWEQVEDQRGREGWLNGRPHKITEFGPLPEGWSDTPPPPSLDESRAETVAAINAAFEGACAAFLSDEPPSARATYATQEAEADAYTRDPTAPTPMLDTLAAARDMDKAELVGRVLRKAALYKQASGLLLGQQQALMDAVALIVAGPGDDALKVASLKALPVRIGLPDMEA